MRPLLYGTTLIGLTISASAQASDWWLIDFGGTRPDRMVIFIDKAGIRKVGSKFQAWQSNYYEHPTPSSPAITEKQLREYDCEARTTSLVSWIEYDSHGASIKSDTYPAYSRSASPAAPDTLADSELVLVCGENSSAFEINNFDPIISGRIVLDAVDHPAPAKR